MIAAAVLATLTALSPLIPDPRVGASTWRLVPVEGAAPAEGAAGFLVELPDAPDDAWLARVVALGGRGVPLVALAPPPPELREYFDAVAVGPRADPLAAASIGLPWVAEASEPAEVVRALAAGAAAALVPARLTGLAAELEGLLPEPQAARSGGAELPTAMRSRDLTTVVGIPAGFAGGRVVLPGSWYAAARLAGGGLLPLDAQGLDATVSVPPSPGGGVLIAERPPEAVARIGVVEVSADRLPTVAEVLARHHRAAAAQERSFSRWRATQRLTVRVWVGELSRSFEVTFEGPAFHERGAGTDWEIASAWVDGVAWRVDDLPDLPLLEPERPPVPPLAVRLDPGWRYSLHGLEERGGRVCWAVGFESAVGAPGARRRGRALLDAASFDLVALEESAEGLAGDVRSTRSAASFDPVEAEGGQLWLPSSVVADDLMTAFGGSATVHRELTLREFVVEPAEFAAERAAAWARPQRMLRDTPSGVVPLVPDGRGGRVAGGGPPPRQRFIIGGVIVDPGIETPIPYGGLQIQDFRFRGRDEQLRALIAGVVNDVAWSRRFGATEVTARAFLQALAFESEFNVAGEEVEEQAVELRRQRVGVGVARSLGPVRVALDAGVDRLDFSRADTTDAGFVLPDDGWEWNARAEATAAFGATTVTASAEQGWRPGWEAWGLGGTDEPEKRFRRGRLLVVHETAPLPMSKLHLDAELLVGDGLDRFSAFAPGRWAAARIRGVAANRFLADRLAIARASLSLPLAPKVRVEGGVDLAWVRDPFSGYHARPVNGVGVSASFPGPWRTLVQAGLGVPLTTPGARAVTFELFVLRPLGRSGGRAR
ncbi:MAG: hypothetical protein ACOY3Y_10390 [Acidobacteriota bacterium]